LCVRIPIKAPKDALTRQQETPIEFLERIKYYYNNWVKPGHRNGVNTHNISATISVKPEEWEGVGNWMWENKTTYNGLSVLPYDGGSYIQAPFEEITEEKYEELYSTLQDIDFSQIIELEDNTTQADEIACGADGCEIK
jgi:ribonucleoside-diphosphate reductase alpha chain